MNQHFRQLSIILLAITAAFGLISTVLFFYTQKYTGEDYNMFMLQAFSLQKILVNFHEWSQSFILDYIILGLLESQTHALLFICIGLIYSLFFYGLYSCIKSSGQLSGITLLYIALFLFFQSPLELGANGYISGYIKYFLPAVLSLIAIKLLCSNQLNGLQSFAFFAATAVASNQEIAAVGLLIAMLYITVFTPQERVFTGPFTLISRPSRTYGIIGIIICLFNLYLYFTSGQMTVRSCLTAIEDFPNFTDLGIFYKLYMGYSATVLYYFAQLNVFTIFLLTAVIYTVLRQTRYELNTLSLTLTAVVCGCVLFGLGFLNELESINIGFKYANRIEMASVLMIVLTLFATALILFILVGIIKSRVMSRKSKTIFLMLLGCGIIARMVMSFRPDLFSFPAKTFAFTNMCFLAAGVFLFLEAELLSSAKLSGVVIVCALLSILPRIGYMSSEGFKNYPTSHPVVRNTQNFRLKCLKDNKVELSLYFGNVENYLSSHEFNELEVVKSIKSRKKLLVEKIDVTPVFNKIK